MYQLFVIQSLGCYIVIKISLISHYICLHRMYFLNSVWTCAVEVRSCWFTSINIELCTQNYQIKGAVWFNLAVVTKKYKIFIKRYCPRIWDPGIKCSLELFPKRLYVHTSPKNVINRVSFLSTKRTVNVIFNTHVH